MTTYQNNTNTSQARAAVAAGLGLLLMAILAFFANFAALEGLVVNEDAVQTVNNISGNQTLFRFGIAAFMLVIVLDVVVAWALWIYFKPANSNLSMLTASFRLVFAAIFASALPNLSNALLLAIRAESSSDVALQVMMSLESFHYAWQIALLFFAFHLLFLGYVVIKSNYVPNILGSFLLAAGLAYMVDSLAHFLLLNYTSFENVFLLIVVVPAIMGELSLCFWLLIKGARIQKTRALVTPSQTL